MYRQELLLLCSAHHVMILYISIKFHENILNGFQVIEGTQNYHCQISKGNNSKKVLTRVTVLELCKFSHDALYFYEVSLKRLKRFSSYRADTNLPLSNFKREQLQKCVDKSYCSYVLQVI